MSRGATPALASRGGLSGAYWRQWSASAVSNLGDGICFAAVPLLAFSLTDDERLLSLTTVATLVPWLLLAIPVGVLVDRADRRQLLVAADLARLALFAVLAVATLTDRASIGLLLALLLAIGAFEVVFDSTAQAFVPMLVRPSELQRANGYLLAAEVVAGSLLGLSVGALLFDASEGLPFALNAVSFGVAALLVLGIRTTSPAPVAASVGRDGMSAGLRWLGEDPLLRTLAALLAVSNFGLMLGQGVFVKFAATELGVGSVGYGILLAVTALGAAAGGLVGHRVAGWLGVRGAIVVPYLVMAVGQASFAVVPLAWFVGAMGAALGASITVWNVVTVSLRQELVPHERFGRVNSVYRWVGTGAGALGAAVGGQLAYAAGLKSTYLVAGAVTLAALVALGPGLTRELRRVERG